MAILGIEHFADLDNSMADIQHKIDQLKTASHNCSMTLLFKLGANEQAFKGGYGPALL